MYEEENKEIDDTTADGTVEYGDSERRSYQGTQDERIKIRDALDAVWAGGDGQSLVADELAQFFGPDPDGDGWRIFEAWLSKCQTPDRDISPPRRTPLEEWTGALEKRHAVCSMSQLIQRVQGVGRVVGRGWDA